MIRWRWALLAVLIGGVFSAIGCGGGNSVKPNPTPVIASIFPDSITAGGAMFNIDITGQGFIGKPVTVALWNGSPRTTTFNSSTGHLVVTILATDITNPGIALLTLMNPTPGGGTSSGATFVVNPLQNGAPMNVSLDPSSANAGTKGPFKLTVNGTGFVAGSVIRYNGTFRQPDSFSPTSLTTELTTTDLQSAGFAAVWVDNPLPGGIVASSVAVDFTIAGKSAATLTFPQVVSVNALGGPANGRSAAPAMSADGRFVAFISNATNLLPMPNRGNVFVRDTCLHVDQCTPVTYPVDLASDGSAPNGKAVGGISISGDGRFVAFSSTATNLVAESAGSTSSPAARVFVRETCLGGSASPGCRPHTILLRDATSSNGASASFDSPSVSADGRFVAFRSIEQTDDSGQRATETRILVSDTCQGASATGYCAPLTIALPLGDDGSATGSRFRPQISPDGRYVVFGSSDAGRDGSSAEDAGTVFLADSCFGTTGECAPILIQISDTGSPSFRLARAQDASVSAGGRFVVFRAETVSALNGTTLQQGLIFLRDTCIGATAKGCVPTTKSISVDLGSDAAAVESFAPQITANGRFVTFASASRGAVRGFIYDTCFDTAGPCTPQIAAIPSVDFPDSKDLSDSLHVPVSADGRFAAFYSVRFNNPLAPISGQGDVFLTPTAIP